MAIRRSFAITAIVWNWYSNAAGFLFIAVGLSWALVVGLAEDGPVFEASDVRPITTRTVPGGVIVYVYDQDRFAPCPGEVSETFSRIGGPNGSIYEQRRHVVFSQPKFYDDLEIRVHVPQDIKPGRYKFQDGIYSRCPTFNRYDPIGSFDVEIVPPNNLAGP